LVGNKKNFKKQQHTGLPKEEMQIKKRKKYDENFDIIIIIIIIIFERSLSLSLSLSPFSSSSSSIIARRGSTVQRKTFFDDTRALMSFDSYYYEEAKTRIFETLIF
jgi:hypothetical protein